jgi:hypothetical protein
LIFRIETLREELEENPNLNEENKTAKEKQISQFLEQLNRLT